MKRRTLLASLAAAAVSRCAPSRRARGKHITYGQSTAVLTLDPAHGCFTGYPAGYEAALCLYDRLLDFDAAMKIVPELAEQFSMASDMKSATLKLRNGVTFHDGTKLDAAAVKINIERMMDAKRNPTNRPLWDPIAGVETPDGATVVIRLRAPFAQLPNTLAHGSGAMVSPAALEKYGESGIAKNPVGAGPFRMASFNPGQELVVEAYDSYWDGKPVLSRIVFRYIAEPATRLNALRTQAVDVIDSVPVALVGALKDDANVKVLTSPGLRPIGFALNLSREPLKDARVRQALNLAVPVDLIAQKVFLGYARAPDSPLAFNTEGYHSVSKLVFDPAKAKALLAEAGFTGSKPLTLAMYASNGLFPNDAAVAQVVANALKQVGVDAAITQVESGSYWDALRQDGGEREMGPRDVRVQPSNASGLYALDSLFKSNANDAARPDVWNIGRYRNPKVDELLASAGTAPDATARRDALAQAQTIIWHDNPYIWLQINENIVASAKPVRGVEVWPIVFTSLRHASVA